MNHKKNYWATLAVVSLFWVSGMGQVIVPLGSPTDNYIGGIPNNAGYIGDDVIGNDNVFDLDGAEVSFDLLNGSLEVKILGNYFDNILEDKDLLGTSMGDLFISTDGLNWGGPGENTDTTQDYVGSGNETSWEYAVQLGTYEQPGLTAGTQMDGSMVDLSAAGTGITLSSASGIFRTQQEHLATGTWDHAYTDPTWVIEDGSLTITINDFFDFFGTNVEAMGFHWAMSCANDVIEFEVPVGSITTVPEPATVGVLGLFGMAGFLLLRRRLIRRK